MFITHYSYGLFRHITLKNITKAISVFIHQKKPCFHLELDSALQAEKDIANEMQTI